MRFRKGDKVRDKKERSEWSVDRIGPGGNRIYCSHSGKDKTVCFSKEDLDLIRREQSHDIIP